MTQLSLPLEADTPSLLPKPLPKAASPARQSARQSRPALDVADMAGLVAQHPDYRVLRRLAAQAHFTGTGTGPRATVLILDTETTGLAHTKEQIIELALLRVQVDTDTGLPVGDVVTYDGLEDPGKPIPEEIRQITGISDDMVRGQKLDEGRIAAMLADVDLVIAHNAAFDRPFCEARYAGFVNLPWACSLADIDWKKEGRNSAKLEHLALHQGWFYEAHRAEMDCHALLAVLVPTLPTDGKTGLLRLLGTGSAPSYRLQASHAPFEAKTVLKARGYRWDAEQRVWHTRLADETALAAECSWLKTAVYGGRSASVQVETRAATAKYSARPGALSERQL
ncbi:MAG: 3'-5' exonuclease [Betaproteobacteria bacterium]